jgi:hypothetical protein
MRCDRGRAWYRALPHEYPQRLPAAQADDQQDNRDDRDNRDGKQQYSENAPPPPGRVKEHRLRRVMHRLNSHEQDYVGSGTLVHSILR